MRTPEWWRNACLRLAGYWPVDDYPRIVHSLDQRPEGEAGALRCLVAICHNWPVVYRKSTQSLMELGWGGRVQWAMEAHGFSAIDFAWFHRSPRVDALRDMAATAAQLEGYTHVLFLDADMVWPSDTLVRMLAHHDKGIVSAFYVAKVSPYYPIALRGPTQEVDGVLMYSHDKTWATGETAIRAEDVVGMGCTLVDVAIFDAIGDRPWFAYENNSDGWPMVSEDVPFCRKAAAAGWGVWMDPTVKCGHAQIEIIGEKHFRRWMASEKRTEQSPVTVRGSAA